MPAIVSLLRELNIDEPYVKDPRTQSGHSRYLGLEFIRKELSVNELASVDDERSQTRHFDRPSKTCEVRRIDPT